MTSGRPTTTAWLHRRAVACLAFVILCLMPSLASAQAISQFTNSTTGAINAATTCTAPLVRNFTVGTSFTLSDVDIGILATHSFRGDMQMTLQSPSGTRVQIVNGDANAVDGDNFNVRLNDGGTQLVNTDAAAGNHTTTAPPYQNNFIPNAALSAFNGQNALGTWRLEICDLFPTADDGTFTRADLYLTQAVTGADLSLTKTVSNAAPTSGANVIYTLSVNNAAGSALTATGVTVLDILPAGVTFVSATGTGTYNNATGIWTVGALAPNSTATISITVTVTASSGATITNGAEVRTSSVPDADSTPNNNSTTEDDDAFVNFTVSGARTAGIAPALTCPVGSTVHDWDSIGWPAGTTNGSYALTAIGTMNFNIGISGGVFLNNATYGGLSPSRQNVVTGGLSPAQFSIFEIVDMTSQSGAVTNTISLPTAVPGVQFRLFDIDYNAGQFADRVTVTGTFNGAPVTPVLTNGISNYVIGNSAFGDGTSADNSGNGNVVVTFNSPVDNIVIVYGNHSLAPADPGQQAIAIHDFTFCRPQANLSVTKVSTVVSDGVSATNPKALPAAIMRYCILVSNAGSATATSVAITDALPGNITYIPGSLLSGNSCASATTAEDDNATGTDETDPFGVSVAGTNLTGTAASLGPNAAFAIIFNATVN
nr:proprotein convertase P-domain-containing protein [uncultured Sphingorhabdus sp.]